MRYRIWALIAALTVLAWVFVEMRGQTIRPVCPLISTTGKINTPAIPTSSTGIPPKPENRIPHLIATPDGFTLAGVVEETRIGPGWKSLAKPVIPTFPKSFAEAVRVRSGVADVGCTPVGGNAESKGKLSADGSLVYENAFKGCDVQYRCGALKTEEFIIVKNEQSQMEWSWDLDLGSGGHVLKPRLTSMHTIELVDETGVSRVRINAPQGRDASGVALRASEGLKFRLDGARVTLNSDVAGLKFPLTIDPSWSSTGTMATARALHTASLLNNGSVLVAGGTNIFGDISGAELFDPTSNTWMDAGSMSTTHIYHTSTLLQDGTVVIVGGDPTRLVTELYNPGSGPGPGSWTKLPNLNFARQNQAATLLESGDLLIIAGDGSGQTAEIFNPSTGTWNVTNSTTATYSDRPSAVLLNDGQVLLCAGAYVTGEIYNPTSQTWTKTGNSIYPRGEAAIMKLTNGNILIAGGNVGGWAQSSELFDFGLKTWSLTGSTIDVHQVPTNKMVLLGNGNPLICAGYTTTTEIYTTKGTWAQTGSCAVPRTFHTVTLLADGRVLTAGGYTGANDYRADAELFDPIPDAASQNISTHFGSAASITLTAQSLSQPLTFTAVQTPTHGSLTPISSNGNVTFTPDSSFVGSDSFTFVVNDGFYTSKIATVSISVIDTAPSANSQTINTHFNTAATANLVATDADGDPLSYTFTAPENGALTGTAPNLQYTPAAGYVGADSFTFKSNDGALDSNVATVSINVTDTAPISNAQSINTHFNTAATINLVAIDADGDALTYTITAPVSGTLTGTAPNLQYTPAAGYVGADSFTFKVNDGLLDSNIATISISITDTAPTGTAQMITVTSGIATAVTLAGTDADNDSLTFAIVTLPANGTLTGTPPNMSYTANASFSGTDTFTFKANDGVLDSTPAAVSITVNAPVPTIGSITPTSASAGAPGFTLTVNGTNFVTSSTVHWNDPLSPGTNRTTTFVSTTQLTATISTEDLATPGKVGVYVESPAPVGGLSTVVNLSNGAAFAVYSGPVGSWIVTNTNDAGLGSLRVAMQNCQPGDTVIFDPIVFAPANSSAGTVISTFSELPALSTGNVTIDAQNVRVTVNGAGAGSSNGFVINSANNLIMGLSVTAFTRSGIFITGSAATNNVIGGDRTVGSGPNGQGLRISKSGAFGVQIDNGACNNVVKGCWIGLDASGTTAEPNLGGVLIQGGACTNTIGSTVAGQANVISGNTFEGITISGSGTNGNVIIGNIVGASAVLTAGRALGAATRDDLLGGRSALANGSAGVFLSKGTQGSRVGGSNAGEGNAIAFNAANGVEVHDANSAHNTLRANAISQNTSGGIALFDGSNNGIGAATIATVNPSPVAGLAHVTGSTATDGTIDVFNDAGNQGATYLGSIQSSGGNWAVDVNADISRNITATVTDASGNTSPFGVFLLQAPAFASAPAPSASQALINGTVTFTAPAPSGSTVAWNFGDGSTASGTTATHNYGTPGTYTVTVTMTDSNGFQTAATFSETIVSSNSDISTHHDGFSDEEEAALGSPANPISALFGVNPAKQPMTITKLTIRLNFAKSGRDNLNLIGTIVLPTGYKPAGQHAEIDVGGVIKSFVLDKNGKGVASDGILKITIPKSAGAAKYQASMTRGSFAAALSDEGLTGDKDIKTAAARTVIVRLIAAQSLFEKTQTLQYSAKAHKMGSAK